MTQVAQTPSLDLSLPPTEQLDEAAAIAARTARKAGASDAVFQVSAHSGVSLAIRESEVESVEFQRDRELGITVYFGQRKGHAGTADFRPSAIEDAVNAACAIAVHTQDDPANGLPDRDRLATEFTDLNLDHPSQRPLDSLIQIARDCEARGLADPIAQASDGASINASRQIGLLYNSQGFSAATSSSQYGLSLSLIGADDSGKRRDYWYASRLDDSAFEQAAEVADTALQRLRRSLNPRQPKTGQCPVIFPPELARGLISHFLGAISGRALYQRSSFLLEALDQPVFAPEVQILQRPHLARQFGASMFDAEGVATCDRTLVEDGHLRGWLLGSYSARRLGLESTGNAGGAQHIKVPATADTDIQGLMAEAGTGLLVTSLMGQGVNIATGQYSRGATGIWFEQGEPAYPVDECTIAGQLAEMYAAINTIASDSDPYASIEIGSVLIDNMTVAGQ